MELLTQFRSFDRPSRMLMINQFGINLGFYMLMPYLAAYLAGPLGLAGWAVGLVLVSATSPNRACSLSAARWLTGSATNR